MSDANQITQLLRNQKHFKIRLPHYDGGSQIFWPEYRHAKVRVMYGDLIAVWLGEEVEFALVRTVTGDLVDLTMIAKVGKPNPTLHVKTHKNRVIALFHPE